MVNAQTNRVLLEVRVPKSTEQTSAHFEQILSNLSRLGPQTISEKLLLRKPSFTFEIVSASGTVHFVISTPPQLRGYLESQLAAQYPKIVISPIREYMGLFEGKNIEVARLVFNFPSYFPLKTAEDFGEIDSLSGVLGTLAKVPADCLALVQILIRPMGSSWRGAGHRVIARGVKDPTNGTQKSHPQASLIQTKIDKNGFAFELRLAVKAGSPIASRELLFSLAGAYGVFDLGEGNSFRLARPIPPLRPNLLGLIKSRRLTLFRPWEFANTAELAGLYHLPNKNISGIRNLAWGRTFLGEPPENLPVAQNATEKEKHAINFFGRTEYKNKQTIFGVKRGDRRRHMYVIGKTGAGKSTLIANMAINDMRNKEGVAVIDPHGDLSSIMLDYIPSYRLNDVVYLDPSDTKNPFHFNPLEVKASPENKELIASGIVSIFYKLYAHSWGPRLEYILRNTILTLLEYPNATLVDVAPLLTNDAFRDRVLLKVTDPVIKRFWVDEFANMHPRLKSEAIAPILNKIGQFVTSPLIRGIIGSPVSTIDLQEIMDKGKILILNLSQGKLGEDNAALLGAMFITKMQLAAMHRVYQEEEKRKDFYMYVDEFQNFATTSFIKILSEARKYRLNLILANQYIGQIHEDVQKAIFGNTGSLLCFPIGAGDAHLLAREFAGLYKDEELVSLSNYQIILKLAIDNITSMPFFATTLPLPSSKNKNKEKAIKNSRERYTKKAK
ncbi:type IV secretion system DNA-binding domain-containing protein [Candidatus Gottesmanbacteria bacterium]|nr:type IV secretion system DNA-binding domain-containing protein [Candidatus Gottesmanbacteria bacterium]